jgi:hypothetical protein
MKSTLEKTAGESLVGLMSFFTMFKNSSGVMHPGRNPAMTAFRQSSPDSELLLAKHVFRRRVFELKSAFCLN